jgi:hypothetical protein
MAGPLRVKFPRRRVKEATRTALTKASVKNNIPEPTLSPASEISHDQASSVDLPLFFWKRPVASTADAKRGIKKTKSGLQSLGRRSKNAVGGK